MPMSDRSLSSRPMSDVERFAEQADGHHLSRSPASGETADLLALVSALRSLDFEVRPSELTRIRQRQRLVAMAAVRPSAAAGPAEAGRHRARHSAQQADWYLPEVNRTRAGSYSVWPVPGWKRSSSSWMGPPT